MPPPFRMPTRLNVDLGSGQRGDLIPGVPADVANHPYSLLGEETFGPSNNVERGTPADAQGRPIPQPRGGVGAASGPAVSGWAEATGRPYQINPDGSITMQDRPGGPGQSPYNRNLFAGSPGRVTSLLQRSLNQGAAGGGAGGMMSDLRGALDQDVAGAQGAADRQFRRNQGQIDSFGNFVRGVGDAINEPAQQGADTLTGAAGEANRLGDQAVSDYNQRADQVRGDLGRDIDAVFRSAGSISDAAQQALGYARGAVSAASSAVSGYDAGANDNIANTVAGIDRRMQGERQRIQSGLNPDGTKMSPAEQQAALRNLNFDTAQAVSGTVATIRDQQQQTLANLRMSLGQVSLGAGQVALGAADAEGKAGQLKLAAGETRARVGTELAQGGLQAEQVRQGYRQLGAGLLQNAAAMRNTAAATAVQLEMEGRVDLANMVRANPESYVGRFNALLALYGVATSPGAGNRRRIA